MQVNRFISQINSKSSPETDILASSNMIPLVTLVTIIFPCQHLLRHQQEDGAWWIPPNSVWQSSVRKISMVWTRTDWQKLLPEFRSKTPSFILTSSTLSMPAPKKYSKIFTSQSFSSTCCSFPPWSTYQAPKKWRSPTMIGIYILILFSPYSHLHSTMTPFTSKAVPSLIKCLSFEEKDVRPWSIHMTFLTKQGGSEGEKLPAVWGKWWEVPDKERRKTMGNLTYRYGDFWL